MQGSISHRLLVVTAVLLLGAAGLRADDGPAANGVDLHVVNYKGLSDIIDRSKGKVVVVDFWSTTCLPCQREFPNLVRMHQEYARDGLVAVSVSLEENPLDTETRQKALAFLRRKNATLTNVMLNESTEVWQQKFDQATVPFVYVFNREGKWVKKFSGKFDYAQVERLALDLLKK
jgi:thiol-disulfide isomerase/thioredoxin